VSRPLLLSVFIWLGLIIQAQVIPVDTVYRPKRLALVASTEAVLSVSSYAGLYFLWYQDYQGEKFHVFNDNSEWLQVDKVGHATTSYFMGKLGFDLLQGCGVSKNKSLIYGGGIGFAYLSVIEIMDGFSSGWGFSWGDMAANAFGTGLFIGQQAFLNEQFVKMKYSYHTTHYAQYRPNLLGQNTLQQVLKDYNGHTYWLSWNLSSFLPKSSTFPQWINIATGYGAKGMLGGFSNPTGPEYPVFDRTRQFYLSLDVDFSRIPTKNPWLKGIFNLFNFIKFPFPALEFGSDGATFHPIYF
jgi:hypothetical protein